MKKEVDWRGAGREAQGGGSGPGREGTVAWTRAVVENRRVTF